jgi:hypothetical protein
VWALLHNLGPSKLVLLDLETGERVREIGRVGSKAHGLVPWEGGFVILNSGEGQLCLFTPPDVDAGSDARGGTLEVLWSDEDRTFMKGLTVIDGVAYFGIAEFGTRANRDDASKTAEVAAYDLRRRDFMWRVTVETRGLLNIVAAPHLAEHSTYKPVDSWGAEPLHTRDLTKGGGWRGTRNGDSFAVDANERARPSAGWRPSGIVAPSGVPWIDLRRKKASTSNEGCRPAHPAHARGHRGAARGVAEHARFLREGVAGGQRVARRARVEHGQVQAGRGQRDPHLLRPRREAGV